MPTSLEENQVESAQLWVMRVAVSRAGAVREVVRFLDDLDAAYTALYKLNDVLEYVHLRSLGSRTQSRDALIQGQIEDSDLLPDERLRVYAVSLSSPGFWEFIGALHPLETVRRFLHDHHKRRQDRQYRERAEAEKLRLENELLAQQVLDATNDVISKRVEILKSIGYKERELKRLVARYVEIPLRRLASHEESGLIDQVSSSPAPTLPPSKRGHM